MAVQRSVLLEKLFIIFYIVVFKKWAVVVHVQVSLLAEGTALT